MFGLITKTCFFSKAIIILIFPLDFNIKFVEKNPNITSDPTRFAISNIFAYYYLSLDRYVPVIISGVFGLLQMGLVICFHDSLEQVVTMQILAMVLLLVVQLVFFFLDYLENR